MVLACHHHSRAFSKPGTTRRVGLDCAYTPAMRCAVHPLAEVRSRTLQNLDFKLRYGLIGTADLLQVCELISSHALQLHTYMTF